MDAAAEAYKVETKKLYIRVTEELDSSITTEALTKSFRTFPGDIPVILYYEKNKRTIQLPRKDWVDGSESCLTTLKDILGKENVILQ